MNILVIDDEPGLRSGLKKMLSLIGHDVSEASDGREARAQLRRRQMDIVLLDLVLGVEDGMEILRDIVPREPMTVVIIITGNGDIKSVVDCMKIGARNYLTKPIDQNLLLSVIEKEAAIRDMKRENLALKSVFEDVHSYLLVESANEEVRETERIIQKVKDSAATVLILGETGTGKEIIARRIHTAGLYRDRPFIGLNCASLNENLVESELFGHEKGAFTGAVERKLGRFELAESGILFLDEIGDMAPSTQAKLLRVLEEREFTRVGGTQSIRARCRIISATNRDLPSLIEQGRFRQDLFYRLSLVRVTLTPLRKRREDIPALIDLFIREGNEIYHKAVTGADPVSLEAAQRYDWPGNIRELKNVIMSKLILADADRIGFMDIIDAFDGGRDDHRLKRLVGRQNRELERKMILDVLERELGNVSETARRLGISRKTLYEKMGKYGIERHLRLLGNK